MYVRTEMAIGSAVGKGVAMDTGGVNLVRFKDGAKRGKPGVRLRGANERATIPFGHATLKTETRLLPFRPCVHSRTPTSGPF